MRSPFLCFVPHYSFYFDHDGSRGFGIVRKLTPVSLTVTLGASPDLLRWPQPDF